MGKTKRNTVVYSLCIEDINTVAEQEIERTLTIDEIDRIKDHIATRINWYDAISDAIHQGIRAE
jgi:hypothetical protein